MIFHASLDTLAKWLTIIVSVLLLFMVGKAIQYYPNHPAGSVLSVTLASAVVLFSLLYRPLNYALTDEYLIVHRLFRDVTIKRKDIKSIRQLRKDELKGTLRLFGVGGFFGYFGFFGNYKLGDMTWYLTRRDTAILIETTTGRKIILSPDEPAIFTEQFNIKNPTP